MHSSFASGLHPARLDVFDMHATLDLNHHNVTEAQQGKEESRKTAEDRVARAGEKGSAVPTTDDGKPKDAAWELGATDHKTTGDAAKEV